MSFFALSLTKCLPTGNLTWGIWGPLYGWRNWLREVKYLAQHSRAAMHSAGEAEVRFLPAGLLPSEREGAWSPLWGLAEDEGPGKLFLSTPLSWKLGSNLVLTRPAKSFLRRTKPEGPFCL